MSKGWECPKCGSCWAPFVQECTKCRPTQMNSQRELISDPCSHEWADTNSGRWCNKCGIKETSSNIYGGTFS